MKHTETRQTKRPMVAECHTDVPETGIRVYVPAGEQAAVFLISARFTNMDANYTGQDLVTQAKSAWLEANSSSSLLFEEHVKAMQDLNAPGIEVEGNVELASLVNSSMYSLLGSYREDSNFSGAPEGLVSTRYYGDAFWDVETWQWPTWLAFWPGMARAALAYRSRLLRQAKANAQLPLPNYPPNESPVHDGLRFPWQSALEGVEQDPGNSEDHIQGDVATAFRQYWYATQDVNWLKHYGFPVIEGVARFYASRVVQRNGTFHIERTTGPDEYYSNVTDSTYGNALARASLQAAYDVAAFAGAQPNETFKAIAAKMFIPYDSGMDYHPEFVGYNTSMKIKQADTALMGYPLSADMPASTQQHDLEIYSRAQDAGGVAMTWGIHAILWRELGDEARAEEAFRLGFASPPFYTWHEGLGIEGSSAQGAPNLLTAAGMFLQSAWAGYGGVRFRPDGTLALLRPRPLPNSTALRLRRLCFLGARLDLSAELDGWTLALSPSSPASAPPLELVTDGQILPLTARAVHVPAGHVGLVRRSRELLVV